VNKDLYIWLRPWRPPGRVGSRVKTFEPGPASVVNIHSLRDRGN